MARVRQIRGGTGRLGGGGDARSRRIAQERNREEFSRKPFREPLGITAGTIYSQSTMQEIIDRLDQLLEDDVDAGLRQNRRQR